MGADLTAIRLSWDQVIDALKPKPPDPAQGWVTPEELWPNVSATSRKRKIRTLKDAGMLDQIMYRSTAYYRLRGTSGNTGT